MPYAPHIRVTALGRLGATGERFAYGLNMSALGANPTVTANFPTWDDIAADIRDFHGSQSANLSATAILEEVKFASIGPDGKYTSDPYLVDVADAPGGVAANAFVLPQTALAVSLNTARRGPTGKGRFYLPMVSRSVDPVTCLLSVADATTTATGTATLISNLNNQPGVDQFPGFQVVVASTKGYNTPVTSVRVGRVLDTIRSRRRQLDEQYAANVAVTT